MHVYMKTSSKIIDIGKMKQELGSVIDYLSFLHSITGCDTTSMLYAFGNMSTITKQNTLEQYSKIFVEKGKIV